MRTTDRTIAVEKSQLYHSLTGLKLFVLRLDQDEHFRELTAVLASASKATVFCGHWLISVLSHRHSADLPTNSLDEETSR